MPYTLTNDPPFLRLGFMGHVMRADLFAAVAELEQLESSMACVPDRLVDLTRLDFSEIKGTDVYAIADRRRQVRFPNRFRSAIVAVHPAQVGYGRMFQTYSDHPDITVRIFTDLAAATAWLASPPSPDE